MNRITELFDIKYPIIQAGMLWTSGWRLASAASNSGCLGLIGAASMYPDVLREHIQKCKKATDKPFGVNVPLGNEIDIFGLFQREMTSGNLSTMKKLWAGTGLWT